MMFSQILKSCPADHYLTRITKADKDFAKTLVLKIQIFQSKLETFTKSKKNNSTNISIFGYENKEKISNLGIKKNMLTYC